MDPNKQITVVQIRRLAKSSRGQSQNLLSLDDEAIYQIFYQLQNGSGNRATARFLREKYNIGGSENSLQQSIGKLKKKIEPLLRNVPVKRPEPSLGKRIKEVDDYPSDKKLATLSQIEADYRDLINDAISKSREAGILSADLHKHITALSNLSKTRAPMEKDSLKDSPQSPIKESTESEEKLSKLVLDRYIGNDGQKMARAAQAFLMGLEKKCVTMNLNPDTGEYEKVEKLNGRS
jgi:hypothetical protein